MCESHHHVFPIEWRPGEGGEGHTESVTACARKMAVGINLYCWLILVHLFYNNKIGLKLRYTLYFITKLKLKCILCVIKPRTYSEY